MHYKKVLRYSKFGLLLAVILLFINNFKHDLTEKIPKIEKSESSELSEDKNEAFDESLFGEIEEPTIEKEPIEETPTDEINVEEFVANKSDEILNSNRKVEVKMFNNISKLIINSL